MKERDTEEEIKREIGEKREGERLDYFILLNSIYYFNELYGKIKIMGVL